MVVGNNVRCTMFDVRCKDDMSYDYIDLSKLEIGIFFTSYIKHQI